MGEYGEPWSVVEQGNTVKSKRVVTAHGASVASSLARSSGWAERIAACVNALDGVPDEAIPMVAKLVELARTKSDKLAEAYRELMIAMAVGATKDDAHE